MFHLFVNELARLCEGRFPFSRILAGAVYGLFFGHAEPRVWVLQA
jgi:hypothetical protein